MAEYSGCAMCARGDHKLCTGLDGPLTTHPDSLPICACSGKAHDSESGVAQ